MGLPIRRHRYPRGAADIRSVYFRSAGTEYILNKVCGDRA